MTEEENIAAVTAAAAVIAEAQRALNNSPSISNPGTPRSGEGEVRATPPLPAPQVRSQQPASKYGQLLGVIEDMGRDIRPTYAGNRTSAERLKRSIVHARILVRECLMECERSARS